MEVETVLSFQIFTATKQEPITEMTELPLPDHCFITT